MEELYECKKCKVEKPINKMRKKKGGGVSRICYNCLDFRRGVVAYLHVNKENWTVAPDSCIDMIKRPEKG